MQTPTGETTQERLGLKEYLQIVAATNFKQRIRKTVEYFHADRLNYAVIGTPNRLEYDQGFFVKNGDGTRRREADRASLQDAGVRAGAPPAAAGGRSATPRRPPTRTACAQGQDEFYFALPYQQMDLALWALNHGRDAAELGRGAEIDADKAAQTSIGTSKTKRRTTRYMHLRPVLAVDVPEIHP